MREVPVAVCWGILKKKTRAGTITIPPPIPNMPERIPARIPVKINCKTKEPSQINERDLNGNGVNKIKQKIKTGLEE
jgi:hypothetical protein